MIHNRAHINKNSLQDSSHVDSIPNHLKTVFKKSLIFCEGMVSYPSYSSVPNCKRGLIKWGRGGNSGEIFMILFESMPGWGYNMCQCVYLDELCINQLIKICNSFYFVN